MKKTIWIIIVILVAAVIVWAVTRKSGPSSLYNYPTPSTSATPKKGVPTYKGVPSGPTSTASQTYTQLISQYAGSYIQFNDMCQGTPGQLAVKKGAKIMA